MPAARGRSQSRYHVTVSRDQTGSGVAHVVRSAEKRDTLDCLPRYVNIQFQIKVIGASLVKC